MTRLERISTCPASCCPSCPPISAELPVPLALVGWLLSNSRLPQERHGQLLAECARSRRSLHRSVQPCPQVTEDKQLLAQQRRQGGKRPAEAGLHLQILQDQHGDQRRPDLSLDCICACPQDGLHLQ